jgi:TPR repeat protein
MNKLPEFFVQYDLPADADERAVKRVYARQLKLIDQETDLAGFQALRDAFEVAMVWLQYRQQANTQDTSLEIDPQGPANGSVDSSQNSQTVDASVLVTSMETANLEAVAQDIIVAMINDMRSHYYDPLYAGKCFMWTMDDARLVHMETSQCFEGMLVRYLLQGWQPGNGELFDVAVEYYGWKKDSRRLHNWGEGGYILSRAIAEQAEFNTQDEGFRGAHWALLLKARYEYEPEHYYLLVHFPMMLRLLETYPTWVFMVTSRGNIEAWHQRYASLQQEMQAETAAKPEPVRQAVADSAKKIPYFKTRFVMGVLICFVFLLKIASVVFKSEPARVYTPDTQQAQTQVNYMNNSFLNLTERRLQDSKLSGEQLKDMGDKYFSTEGGKIRNVIEAVYFWEMASEKGNVEASYQLASIYEQGIGVVKDVKQSYQWHEKAAQQGEPRSQVLMGDFYLSETNRNLSKALYFYEMAAKKGSLVAKRSLAAIYDDGLAGLTVDLDKASFWYAQAAENGDPQSRARLKTICMKKKYAACSI